jgi:hypothetical protein
MLPIGWGLKVILIAVLAVSGAIVGATSGTLISQLFGAPMRMGAVLRSGLLGALASAGGFLACAVVPWPRNTITPTLEDNRVMQITMNRFQHPEAVAFALAVLLPALHQTYRHWRAKSAPGKTEFALK